MMRPGGPHGESGTALRHEVPRRGAGGRGVPEPSTSPSEGLLVRAATCTRRLTAPSVAIIDGSGAGDAFAAGLIVGILEGWPLERSLTFASEVGALAYTALGCTDGIPDRQRVSELVEQHR